MTEYIDSEKIRIIPDRKSYKIKYTLYDNKNNDKFVNYKLIDLTFKTVKCTIPFGLEKYQGKLIANLEFDISDNDTYNYITSIKNIETIFSKIKTDSSSPSSFSCKIKNNPRLKEDIEKCYFISSIKDRTVSKDNKKFHHRCHIEDFKKFPYSSSDLMGKTIIAEIKLERLWIHKDTYGLLWYITNINFVNE